MSQLTEDQINLVLARHFEPDPQFNHGNNELNGRDALSNDGYWWCEQHHRYDGEARHPVEITKNAGVILVMMKKAQITVSPGGDGWKATYCNWATGGEITAVGTTGGRRWQTGPTIGIAVSLAYIEEKGL